MRAKIIKATNDRKCLKFYTIVVARQRGLNPTTGLLKTYSYFYVSWNECFESLEHFNQTGGKSPPKPRESCAIFHPSRWDLTECFRLVKF